MATTAIRRKPRKPTTIKTMERIVPTKPTRSGKTKPTLSGKTKPKATGKAKSGKTKPKKKMTY